jgi:phosphate transport system permease protein
MTVLKGTGSTLTTFTYFNSPAGEGNSEALAFGAALVLIALVLALNFAALAIARSQQRAGRS